MPITHHLVLPQSWRDVVVSPLQIMQAALIIIVDRCLCTVGTFSAGIYSFLYAQSNQQISLTILDSYSTVYFYNYPVAYQTHCWTSFVEAACFSELTLRWKIPCTLPPGLKYRTQRTYSLQYNPLPGFIGKDTACQRSQPSDSKWRNPIFHPPNNRLVMTESIVHKTEEDNLISQLQPLNQLYYHHTPSWRNTSVNKNLIQPLQCKITHIIDSYESVYMN